MKKIKSHIPFTAEVDDGLSIDLGMKRLSYEDGVVLRSRYNEANSKAGEEREALWGPMILETIRDYVRVEEPMKMELADGEVELKTGTDLLAAFGGSPGALNEILSGAIAATLLSPRQKKVWRSRIASLPSSDAPSPEVPGPKPESTATSAEGGTSADNGDAPARQEPSQSGSTEESTPSSSTNVPSVH